MTTTTQRFYTGYPASWFTWSPNPTGAKQHAVETGLTALCGAKMQSKSKDLENYAFDPRSSQSCKRCARAVLEGR